MRRDSPLRERAGQRPGLRLSILCLAGALGGCAQLPDPVRLSGIKSPDAFEARVTLKAAEAAWPVERWWTAYGDPQLDALIDEALAGAPDLAVAAARVQRAEAVTEVVASADQLQLGASAAITEEKLSYNYLVPRSPRTEGWNDYGRATLDLRWTLDFWGRNRAALAAATSELEAGRAELAQARLMLAAGVAAQYAELGRLHASRDTAIRSLELRRKTAALFAQRYANGLDTRGGVSEAEARRAGAEGALLALDEQIALQRNRIAALLGAGPDRGLLIGAPTLKIERGFGLPAQLPVELLGRRPDIVAARLQVQAQERRIEQKEAEFYPNVNLSAFVGLQSLGLDLLGRSGSTVGSLGPAISLPLFSGGRLQGELRGAQSAYAGAVASYNGAVARALQEVADAAVSQRALGQRLLKAQEVVAAAAEAYRVARNRYQGGLANHLELLSAEDGLLNALNAQTQLRANSCQLDIALQRALGGGYQSAQR